MRIKFTIKNLDINWNDFKQMIISNTKSKENLNTCYVKTKRDRGVGFSKKI